MELDIFIPSIKLGAAAGSLFDDAAQPPVPSCHNGFKPAKLGCMIIILYGF